MSGRVILTAAMFAVFTSFAASAQPELDTFDFGGVLFNSWTSRDPDEGHTTLISLTSRERVRDVAYTVLVADRGGARKVLAEGELRNLREGDYQILTSQKQKIPDHAAITACVSYYNIGRSEHFISVSFFGEPAIIAEGRTQHVAGPSLETAVPVRLGHDGNLSCGALLEPVTLQAYLAQERLPAPPTTGASEVERSENPDNISIASLTTWVVNKHEHSLEGLIAAPEDLAAVEYRVRVVDPAAAPGPSEWSGQVPFITNHTWIDFTISNPDGNAGKRLPAENVTLEVCISYYLLSERRYVRERWEALADYRKVLSFADTTLPQTAFPVGEIALEFSRSALGCGED